MANKKKKKKEKFVKKARYSPLQYKLSQDVAMVQAAFATDVATQSAANNQDAESLLTAAEMWLKIGEAMAGATTGREQESTPKFGFDSTPSQRVPVSTDEFDELEEEDE